jgi:hypothetical protein
MLPWLSLLLGCDPVIALDVTVAVPVEIQERFSSQKPGRVVVNIDQSALDRTIAVGLMCDGKKEVETFSYQAVGLGCATKGTISAWVVAHNEDDGVLCGANDVWLEDGEGKPPAGDDTPFDSVLVYTDIDGKKGDCPNAEEHHQLTLNLPGSWEVEGDTGTPTE